MNESGGWLVIWRTSAFLTKSCQWMPRILHRHYWSSASICCRSTFLLPNIQTCQALSGVWRSCIDEAWSQSLYVISTSVGQDSALLNESWRCVCRSQGHCYKMNGSRLPGRQMIPLVGHHGHKHEDWVAHPCWGPVQPHITTKAIRSITVTTSNKHADISTATL